MTRLEHTIEIKKPLSDVYALARQVERYPEFLPGYLVSRIIERRNGNLLLERQAIVKGKLRQWKSWVHFVEEESIHFEHAAGPLQGMQVTWSFTPLSSEQTRLQIVHQLHVRRPRLLGWLLEKTFYAPGVGQMAGQVIQDFKRACERPNVLS